MSRDKASITERIAALSGKQARVALSVIAQSSRTQPDTTTDRTVHASYDSFVNLSALLSEALDIGESYDS